MTTPTPVSVMPDDLGVYLNDPSINTDRASMMIGDAVQLASPIFAPNPVPQQAAGVIRRMAGRGYVTTTSARAVQMGAAGSPMGAVPGGLGGVIMTRFDRADLQDIRDQLYPSGSGGGTARAFTVDLLGADYSLALAPWDSGWSYEAATGGDADQGDSGYGDAASW